MRLDDNTLFITGGASGIGLALAGAFLRRGSRVIVCGRDEAKLAALQAKHPHIQALRCDVTDDGALRRMVAELGAAGQRPNILVNNAGIMHRYDFTTAGNDWARADAELDTNFRAVVHLTALFLPLLLEAPRAAIVNVSSFLGIVPNRSAPLYCASKAALHAFTKSLRYQLEGSSIRVFEVLPPLTDTEMTRGRGNPADKISPEALAEAVLAGIAADREEIRPGRTGRGIWLHRFCPALIERTMKRQ